MRGRKTSVKTMKGSKIRQKKPEANLRGRKRRMEEDRRRDKRQKMMMWTDVGQLGLLNIST